MKKEPKFREFTVAATVLGTIQGIILTVAFTYPALKLGFGPTASTIAAILGFVILRVIMRKGTIVENNINQTITCAINVSGAGIIFTFPVLFLMKQDFDLWPIILASVAGSFLGICIMIPLRKQMIDLDRLRFPSGIAVGVLLKSPGAGAQKALLLGLGCLISLVVVIGMKTHIIPEELAIGKWFGLPDYMQTSISLSLMNFGAGLLSGAGGIPFLLGGILAWWFISPIAVSVGWTAGQEDAGMFIYGSMIRPLGIGMLIGGALIGVVMAYPALRAALNSLVQSSKLAKAAAKDSWKKDSEEMPISLLAIGIFGSVGILFIAALFTMKTMSIPMAFIISIIGTVWLSLAGLIVAQCTGMTDISPISGVALITVTLMLALTSNNVVAAVLMGITVCVATSQCADMMTDLKAGYVVGGVPKRQQLCQYIVVWIGPLVAIGTVILLWNTPTKDFATYVNKDGMLGNRITSVAFDKDWNRWVGSDKGLSKYDGKTWTAYTTKDGLASDDIKAVAVEREAGVVWVGTDKGVSSFDGKTWATYNTGNGLLSDNITSISVDKEANKWFGSDKGLNKYDGKTWTTYTVKHALAGNKVTSLVTDKEGVIWVGTDSGATSYDGKVWTSYTTKDGLVDDNVNGISVDEDNSKWFASDKGACRLWGGFKVTTDSLKDVKLEEKAAESFKTLIGREISTREQFEKMLDNLKVTPEQKSLITEHSKKWNTYTSKDGLLSDTVKTVAVNQYGKWFSTDKGVSMFDGKKWHVYTTKEGLPSDIVNTIIIDKYGNKWFAGEGKLVMANWGPGFGPESVPCQQGRGSCMPAPQAGALQGMIEGVVGGNAPVDKYVAGGLLGAALSILPIGGLGVLVGLAMYLPFSVTLGYGLGCIAAIIVTKTRGSRCVENILVPIATGLIIGESLTELGNSLLIMFGVIG